MSATAEAYILFLFFFIIMFFLYGYFQKRLKIQEDLLTSHNFSGVSVLVQNRLRRYTIAQQRDHINTISGRVQEQYPEAFASVEHITITNELNKPPKYDDSPPSYEDAIKIATAQSLSQHPSSSNPEVVPAVPKPSD